MDQHIQMKFIDTINNGQKNNARSYFKKIDAYEAKTNIGLISMDQNELITFLNSESSPIPQTNRNLTLFVKGFLKWANDANLINNLAYTNISYHDIDMQIGCKENLYQDFEEIQSILQHIGLEDEGFAIYPISIFAWNGLSIKMAQQLRDDDVNLSTGVITTVEPKTFERMTPQMIAILGSYKAWSYSKRKNNITMVSDKRDTFLYRTVINKSDYNPSNKFYVDINAEISKENQKLPVGVKQLSYSSIQKSGKLFKLYQDEINGIDWSIPSNKKILSAYLNSPQAYPNDGWMLYEAYKKAFK